MLEIHCKLKVGGPGFHGSNLKNREDVTSIHRGQQNTTTSTRKVHGSYDTNSSLFPVCGPQ